MWSGWLFDIVEFICWNDSLTNSFSSVCVYTVFFLFASVVVRAAIRSTYVYTNTYHRWKCFFFWYCVYGLTFFYIVHTHMDGKKENLCWMCVCVGGQKKVSVGNVICLAFKFWLKLCVFPGIQCRSEKNREAAYTILWRWRRWWRLCADPCLNVIRFHVMFAYNTFYSCPLQWRTARLL